ncbi:MAG: hypothetical protein R3B49_05715 [Phycisphaerales bacterium]
MPIEPEAFAEHVADLIRRMQPGFAIAMPSPRELLVNGRRLDLENLFRMVVHEPDRGADIVEHFLDQLFSGDSLEAADLPFELARHRIMPHPAGLDLRAPVARARRAHVPFVNNTVIVFVNDLPHMTVSITTEQVQRWGTTAEDLEWVARENLDTYALRPRSAGDRVEGRRTSGDRRRTGRVRRGEAATDRPAPPAGAELGPNFYVATPPRDMFIAMSAGPQGFVEPCVGGVAEDHRRLPYPITADMFLVTMDGVAGTVEHEDDAGFSDAA